MWFDCYKAFGQRSFIFAAVRERDVIGIPFGDYHPLFANLGIRFRYAKVIAAMLHDGCDFKLDGCTNFNIRRSSPRDHSPESVVGNKPYSRLA